MKHYYILFALFISIISISCVSSYNGTSANKSSYYDNDRSSRFPPSEPGKCYAKARFPETVEMGYDTIYHYKNIDNIEHEEVKVVYQEGSQKWVKKKADKNCLSADPNDCLVWCLVEVKEISVMKKIPNNPEMAEVESKEPIEYELSRTPEYTDWVEVVCQNDVTPQLISEIHQALNRENYFTETLQVPEKIDKNLKKRLSLYQIDNRLAKGQLSVETLDALGISY